MMHDFRTWLRARGYAARTVKTYTGYARRAQALVGDLRRADTEALERFLATLPPGAASQRAARKALAAYYDHRGGKNPARQLVVPPEPTRLPRPLSEAEYLAYLRAADRLAGAHRVVGTMFALTGCRFSELRFARWDHITLTGNDPAWRVIGKGSRRQGPKERVIPLHPRLVTVLTGWRHVTPGAYVIPGVRHPWASEDTIRGLHYEIMGLIGLPGAVPHRMRHTAITLAVGRTGDLLAVRDVAGHASVATTQGYAAVLPGRLRAVVDSLG